MNLPRPVCSHLGESPNIDPEAFVADGAVIVGAVTLGPLASVWYGCVLRADIEAISIGEGSNIQDGSIIHLASDLGTTVGDYVTVGHRALLHACIVEDDSLNGRGAIVMDGARIGARSIVAAGALVTKGTQVPPGSLVVGSPARVVKSLPLDEQRGIRHWAEKYIQVSAEHRAQREQKNREVDTPGLP